MRVFAGLLAVLGVAGFGVVLAAPGGPEVYEAQIVDLTTGNSTPPPRIM